MNILCAKHNTPKGHISHLACESFLCTIHHGLGPLKMNASPCQNKKILAVFFTQPGKDHDKVSE